MRPIQFWMKHRVQSAAWRHGHHCITVTLACVSALARWRDLFWLNQGVNLDMVHRRKVVTTVASNKGWGALCKGKPTFSLWSEKESGLHINSLEMLAVCQACQFFLPDIRGHHVLVCLDSWSMVSYINHQGGLVLKRLCMLANKLLVWAQNSLRSLKATHVLGKLNHGSDMLSRKNVSSGEWTLHPLAVQEIWEVSGRAWVHLFASEDNSHCPIFFTKSTDALAHVLPSLPLYAFPPIALLPQVLRRVREQWHKLILIAPLWRNQPWVSELFQLLEAAPWPIPLRRDMMAYARGPSTQRLYALKLSIFSTWCQDRDLDPVISDVSEVLSFLQEMLDKQRSSSTVKVYTAAIAAFHAPIAGRSVGRDSGSVLTRR